MRIEDRESFRLSGADDADVQDGEIEVRDTVPPQVLHEPRVAPLELSRRGGASRPDLLFDRDRERCDERLDHQHGDGDTVERPLIVRKVVGIVDTEHPGGVSEGTHDPDRPEALEELPLLVGQQPVRTLCEVHPVRYGERPVHLEGADMLPDRGM